MRGPARASICGNVGGGALHAAPGFELFRRWPRPSASEGAKPVSIRKLVRLAPVIAVLALAAPVASAGAQTTSGPGSMIPCYPEPAFCGPDAQPWFGLRPFLFPPLAGGRAGLTAPTHSFGPGPVQLPPVR
jgi:hypothetical protein